MPFKLEIPLWVKCLQGHLPFLPSSMESPVKLSNTDSGLHLTPHHLGVFHLCIPIWKEFAHHIQRSFYIFVSPSMGRKALRSWNINSISSLQGKILRSWDFGKFYIATVSSSPRYVKNFLTLTLLSYWRFFYHWLNLRRVCGWYLTDSTPLYKHQVSSSLRHVKNFLTLTRLNY